MPTNTPGVSAGLVAVSPTPLGGYVSLLVLFGIGSLVVLGLLVALFIGAVLMGAGAPAEDDTVDDESIDASFDTHGVHFC
ncbi:hypothetical protein [Halostreptopolyspora alba]|uniref:hypothetical protein n=1 Tax=Halostreptopolyspora alba TaxID=2487137 RepID=UPI0011CD7332